MSYNYADISNYEFKKTIGEGNFAKVKLSIFKPTKEEFAIKIINKKKLQKKMKNTIFRENEIISQLKHPNIITVYEILEDSENYYIIMENCKNGELFDYIVAHQNLSENEASIFFYQLIKGVEYIHSKNIVHRDLKPENLLLTENNILKIIDFGLSHPFDGTEMLKTKCGSPSYAAPEIITGTEYDGFKTDVWCCGVILYAMLCGFLPFEGENDMELFKSIVECDPEIPRELSKESKKLIRKIFIPNPNKRITIPEIKKTDFYLKGKKLYNLKYGIKEFNEKIPDEKKLEFIKEFYNDLCEDDYNQKRNNNNNEIQIVIDGEKNNIFEAIEENNYKEDDRVTIGSNDEEKEDAFRYIKKNNINICDINKLKHVKDTQTINIKENDITNKDSQDNCNQFENNENEVKERNNYMQTYGNVERIKNPKMKLHLNFNHN
jgi:5'-AMP-activated protein kinase catalytic alpha subunit